MAAQRKLNASDTTKPKVWTAKICPFAHRARIALHHKGVDYEKVEVDLGNKPASLFEINPLGTVPAIHDLGQNIYESLICIEYVDDMWESPSGRKLLPDDPAGRAKERIWCDFVGKKIIPNFFGITMEKSREEASQKFLDAMKALQEAMASPGPFFGGADLGLMDICLAPFANRMVFLKKCFQFEVPKTDEYKRYNEWWEALQNHPTYKATKLDDEYIVSNMSKQFKK